jgi:hypothetical protein
VELSSDAASCIVHTGCDLQWLRTEPVTDEPATTLTTVLAYLTGAVVNTTTPPQCNATANRKRCGEHGNVSPLADSAGTHRCLCRCAAGFGGPTCAETLDLTAVVQIRVRAALRSPTPSSTPTPSVNSTNGTVANTTVNNGTLTGNQTTSPALEAARTTVTTLVSQALRAVAADMPAGVWLEVSAATVVSEREIDVVITPHSVETSRASAAESAVSRLALPSGGFASRCALWLPLSQLTLVSIAAEGDTSVSASYNRVVSAFIDTNASFGAVTIAPLVNRFNRVAVAVMVLGIASIVFFVAFFVAYVLVHHPRNVRLWLLCAASTVLAILVTIVAFRTEKIQTREPDALSRLSVSGGVTGVAEGVQITSHEAVIIGFRDSMCGRSDVPTLQRRAMPQWLGRVVADGSCYRVHLAAGSRTDASAWYAKAMCNTADGQSYTGGTVRVALASTLAACNQRDLVAANATRCNNATQTFGYTSPLVPRDTFARVVCASRAAAHELFQVVEADRHLFPSAATVADTAMAVSTADRDTWRDESDSSLRCQFALADETAPSLLTTEVSAVVQNSQYLAVTRNASSSVAPLPYPALPISNLQGQFTGVSGQRLAVFDIAETDMDVVRRPSKEGFTLTWWMRAASNAQGFVFALTDAEAVSSADETLAGSTPLLAALRRVERALWDDVEKTSPDADKLAKVYLAVYIHGVNSSMTITAETADGTLARTTFDEAVVSTLFDDQWHYLALTQSMQTDSVAFRLDVDGAQNDQPATDKERLQCFPRRARLQHLSASSARRVPSSLQPYLGGAMVIADFRGDASMFALRFDRGAQTPQRVYTYSGLDGIHVDGAPATNVARSARLAQDDRKFDEQVSTACGVVFLIVAAGTCIATIVFTIYDARKEYRNRAKFRQYTTTHHDGNVAALVTSSLDETESRSALAAKAVRCGSAIIAIFTIFTQHTLLYFIGWEWPVEFREPFGYIFFIFALDFTIPFPGLFHAVSVIVQFVILLFALFVLYVLARQDDDQFQHRVIAPLVEKRFEQHAPGAEFIVLDEDAAEAENRLVAVPTSDAAAVIQTASDVHDLHKAALRDDRLVRREAREHGIDIRGLPRLHPAKAEGLHGSAADVEEDIPAGAADYDASTSLPFGANQDASDSAPFGAHNDLSSTQPLGKAMYSAAESTGDKRTMPNPHQQQPQASRKGSSSPAAGDDDTDHVVRGVNPRVESAFRLRIGPLTPGEPPSEAAARQSDREQTTVHTKRKLGDEDRGAKQKANTRRLCGLQAQQVLLEELSRQLAIRNDDAAIMATAPDAQRRARSAAVRRALGVGTSTADAVIKTTSASPRATTPGSRGRRATATNTPQLASVMQSPLLPHLTAAATAASAAGNGASTMDGREVWQLTPSPRALQPQVLDDQVGDPFFDHVFAQAEVDEFRQRRALKAKQVEMKLRQMKLAAKQPAPAGGNMPTRLEFTRHLAAARAARGSRTDVAASPTESVATPERPALKRRATTATASSVGGAASGIARGRTPSNAETRSVGFEGALPDLEEFEAQLAQEHVHSSNRGALYVWVAADDDELSQRKALAKRQRRTARLLRQSTAREQQQQQPGEDDPAQQREQDASANTRMLMARFENGELEDESEDDDAAQHSRTVNMRGGNTPGGESTDADGEAGGSGAKPEAAEALHYGLPPHLAAVLAVAMERAAADFFSEQLARGSELDGATSPGAEAREPKPQPPSSPGAFGGVSRSPSPSSAPLQRPGSFRAAARSRQPRRHAFRTAALLARRAASPAGKEYSSSDDGEDGAAKASRSHSPHHATDAVTALPKPAAPLMPRVESFASSTPQSPASLAPPGTFDAALHQRLEAESESSQPGGGAAAGGTLQPINAVRLSKRRWDLTHRAFYGASCRATMRVAVSLLDMRFEEFEQAAYELITTRRLDLVRATDLRANADELVHVVAFLKQYGHQLAVVPAAVQGLAQRAREAAAYQSAEQLKAHLAAAQVDESARDFLTRLHDSLQAPLPCPHGASNDGLLKPIGARFGVGGAHGGDDAAVGELVDGLKLRTESAVAVASQRWHRTADAWKAHVAMVLQAHNETDFHFAPGAAAPQDAAVTPACRAIAQLLFPFISRCGVTLSATKIQDLVLLQCALALDTSSGGANNTTTDGQGDASDPVPDRNNVGGQFAFLSELLNDLAATKAASGSVVGNEEDLLQLRQGSLLAGVLDALSDAATSSIPIMPGSMEPSLVGLLDGVEAQRTLTYIRLSVEQHVARRARHARRLCERLSGSTSELLPSCQLMRCRVSVVRNSREACWAARLSILTSPTAGSTDYKAFVNHLVDAVLEPIRTGDLIRLQGVQEDQERLAATLRVPGNAAAQPTPADHASVVSSTVMNAHAAAKPPAVHPQLAIANRVRTAPAASLHPRSRTDVSGSARSVVPKSTIPFKALMPPLEPALGFTPLDVAPARHICPDHDVRLIPATQRWHANPLNAAVRYTCALSRSLLFRELCVPEDEGAALRRRLTAASSDAHDVTALFVCPSDGCAYAVDTAAARPSAKHRVLSRAGQIVYYLARLGVLSYIGLAALILVQFLYLPGIRSAFSVATCHLSTVCDYRACYDHPQPEFLIVAYFSGLVLVLTALALTPFYVEMVVIRKLRLLSSGLFNHDAFDPIHARRRCKEAGTTEDPCFGADGYTFIGQSDSARAPRTLLQRVSAHVPCVAWHRVLIASDDSMFKALYQPYTARFAAVHPVFFLWQYLAVVFILFIGARGSVQQLAAVSALEAVFAIAIVVSRPFADASMNLLAGLGATHQVALLGFDAFYRVESYNRDAVLEDGELVDWATGLMVTVTPVFLVVIAAITLYAVVVPIVRWVRLVRRDRRRQADRVQDTEPFSIVSPTTGIVPTSPPTSTPPTSPSMMMGGVLPSGMTANAVASALLAALQGGATNAHVSVISASNLTMLGSYDESGAPPGVTVEINSDEDESDDGDAARRTFVDDSETPVARNQHQLGAFGAPFGTATAPPTPNRYTDQPPLQLPAPKESPRSAKEEPEIAARTAVVAPVTLASVDASEPTPPAASAPKKRVDPKKAGKAPVPAATASTPAKQAPTAAATGGAKAPAAAAGPKSGSATPQSVRSEQPSPTLSAASGASRGAQPSEAPPLTSAQDNAAASPAAPPAAAKKSTAPAVTSARSQPAKAETSKGTAGKPTTPQANPAPPAADRGASPATSAPPGDVPSPAASASSRSVSPATGANTVASPSNAEQTTSPTTAEAAAPASATGAKKTATPASIAPAKAEAAKGTAGKSAAPATPFPADRGASPATGMPPGDAPSPAASASSRSVSPATGENTGASPSNVEQTTSPTTAEAAAPANATGAKTAAPASTAPAKSLPAKTAASAKGTAGKPAAQATPLPAGSGVSPVTDTPPGDVAPPAAPAAPPAAVKKSAAPAATVAAAKSQPAKAEAPKETAGKPTVTQADPAHPHSEVPSATGASADEASSASTTSVSPAANAVASPTTAEQTTSPTTAEAAAPANATGAKKTAAPASIAPPKSQPAKAEAAKGTAGKPAAQATPFPADRGASPATGMPPGDAPSPAASASSRSVSPATGANTVVSPSNEEQTTSPTTAEAAAPASRSVPRRPPHPPPSPQRRASPPRRRRLSPSSLPPRHSRPRKKRPGTWRPRGQQRPNPHRPRSVQLSHRVLNRRRPLRTRTRTLKLPRHLAAPRLSEVPRPVERARRRPDGAPRLREPQRLRPARRTAPRLLRSPSAAMTPTCTP